MTGTYYMIVSPQTEGVHVSINEVICVYYSRYLTRWLYQYFTDLACTYCRRGHTAVIFHVLVVCKLMKWGRREHEGISTRCMSPHASSSTCLFARFKERLLRKRATPPSDECRCLKFKVHAYMRATSVGGGTNFENDEFAIIRCVH